MSNIIMKENDLSQIVIGLCIKIHKELGPGLLESVYEEILCYELTNAGLSYKRQQGINVIYERVKMDIGFRADLIIADKLIVELKSVETIAPVHSKILLTYLRLSNIKLGLLINFNVAPRLIDGIKRVANNL